MAYRDITFNKAVWSPRKNELLVAKQEINNSHDQYAIALFKQESESNREYVVGQLLKETSRFTWFVRHGAAVTVKVIDVEQRTYQLVRGGLETNAGRVQKLVNVQYKELVNSNIHDYTADIL